MFISYQIFDVFGNSKMFFPLKFEPIFYFCDWQFGNGSHITIGFLWGINRLLESIEIRTHDEMILNFNKEFLGNLKKNLS